MVDDISRKRVPRSEDPAIPLVLQGVSKVYGAHTAHPVTALDGVHLTLGAGERLAIMGASGSGKSTLLHIAGCLDRPTTGSVYVSGLDVAAIPSRRLHHVRNRWIGFVFQQHHLLTHLTALENVAVPLRYAGATRKAALAHARTWLEQVGLADRGHHFPSELSGGERQRVAVVRALVNRPRLVLADEPTGELDTATSEQILDLIVRLNEEHGVALLIVTHDDAVARRCHRTLRMSDGRLDDSSPPHMILP